MLAVAAIIFLVWVLGYWIGYGAGRVAHIIQRFRGRP
jgi:hypothetical protein